MNGGNRETRKRGKETAGNVKMKGIKHGGTRQRRSGRLFCQRGRGSSGDPDSSGDLGMTDGGKMVFSLAVGIIGRAGRGISCIFCRCRRDRAHYG